MTRVHPMTSKRQQLSAALLRLIGLAILLLAVAPALAQSADASAELGEAEATLPAITPRVIGGQSVREGAWPSTVALLYSQPGSLFLRQFCAGTVIAERWVLTAAHCLHSEDGVVLDPSALSVGAGITNLQNEGSVREVTVTSVILHPDYIPGSVNTRDDIALLELAQPTGLPTLPLYAGDPERIAGSSAVVVGWGAISYSEVVPLTYPTTLQQATVPLVSRSVCNRPESYAGAIAPGQVCAGFQAGGVDACVGDSGGPLMVLESGEFRQVGVVSFGRGCAFPNLYGIYTHAGFYSTWINELLGGQLDVRVAENTPVTTPTNTVSTGGGGSGALGFWALLVLLVANSAWRHGQLRRLRAMFR